MNALLRIALLALCSAAGILMAVQLAGTPATEVEASTAALQPPKNEAPIATTTALAVSPPAQPETVDVAAPAEVRPQAAGHSVGELRQPETHPLREVHPLREQRPQPRTAQQVPDLGDGGSSGNPIADLERRLQQTEATLSQVRQNHQEAIQSIGADPTSDPTRLMQNILNQGGVGAADGQASPAQIEAMTKMIQQAAQAAQASAAAGAPTGIGGDPAPAAPVPNPPAAANPGGPLGGAPAAAAIETLPRPPMIKPAAEGLLSIHSRDDDIRTILEQLGEQAGLNILACASVTGTLSVNLQNVSVEEALAVVLKISGFVSRREGNVVYIGTPADFAVLEKTLDRIATRVYRPNYLTAKELANLLTPILTPNTGKISITSPPSSGIAPDNSTAGGDALAQQDAVVIQDYVQVLDEIEQIFKELDRRPAQVSIEAVIVSVTLDDENEFGVDFQLLRDKEHVRFGWGSPRINPLNGTGATDPATGGTIGEFQFDTGGLKFAFLDDSLGVFINALETVGDANIIASPKLLCLNKQKAEILIGQRLGYISTTVTQTFSTQNVEFLDVGTQLRLRPYISSDGLIRMEVHPELSTGTVTVEGGFTLPNKTLTEVTTNVMCPDGCTVIIGGLMREQLTTDITQVPLLGSLPAVGPLFRHKTDNVSRTEILVLLTPRIIYDEQSAQEGAQADLDTQNIEAMKFHRMNPAGRAHLSRDYVLRAGKALARGDRAAATRLARLAVHYDAGNREAVRMLADLSGSGTVPPLVPQGLGATVVVGEELPQATLDGGAVPEWMLNDLGNESLGPPPSVPVHPRDQGVPGASVEIYRPRAFRNDEAK